MRDFVYDLMSNPARPESAAVRALVEDRIVSSGAADELSRPFLIIRAGAYTRAMADVWRFPFTLYAHDDPGSYVQIDAIQKAVHEAMMSAVDQWWGSQFVMGVTDDGWSDDLFDDHYGTATRFGAYTLTARQ